MNFSKLIEISYALLPRAVEGQKARHFSFLLYRSKIESIGINNPFKTHPLNLRNNYRDRDNRDISQYVGIHSELSAILKFGEEDLSKFTLVNTRIDLNNKLAFSKPCCGCNNLLKSLKLSQVYYSNNEEGFDYLKIT